MERETGRSDCCCLQSSCYTLAAIASNPLNKPFNLYHQCRFKCISTQIIGYYTEAMVKLVSAFWEWGGGVGGTTQCFADITTNARHCPNVVVLLGYRLQCCPNTGWVSHICWVISNILEQKSLVRLLVSTIQSAIAVTHI